MVTINASGETYRVTNKFEDKKRGVMFEIETKDGLAYIQGRFVTYTEVVAA